jgi:hypothetical protein
VRLRPTVRYVIYSPVLAQAFRRHLDKIGPEDVRCSRKARRPSTATGSNPKASAALPSDLSRGPATRCRSGASSGIESLRPAETSRLTAASWLSMWRKRTSARGSAAIPDNGGLRPPARPCVRCEPPLNPPSSLAR